MATLLLYGVIRPQSFERDQFWINRLTVSWDLGILRQKPCILVIENVLGRFHRTAHARYYVTHNDSEARSSTQVWALVAYHSTTVRRVPLVKPLFLILSTKARGAVVERASVRERQI